MNEYEEEVAFCSVCKEEMGEEECAVCGRYVCSACIVHTILDEDSPIGADYVVCYDCQEEYDHD